MNETFDAVFEKFLTEWDCADNAKEPIILPKNHAYLFCVQDVITEHLFRDVLVHVLKFKAPGVTLGKLDTKWGDPYLAVF